MSGVVDESESEEKMADVEAQEPEDEDFGGYTEKVRMLPGSLKYLAEIVADILQGRDRGEGATTARRCSSRRNSLPNHI